MRQWEWRKAGLLAAVHRFPSLEAFAQAAPHLRVLWQPCPHAALVPLLTCRGFVGRLRRVTRRRNPGRAAAATAWTPAGTAECSGERADAAETLNKLSQTKLLTARYNYIFPCRGGNKRLNCILGFAFSNIPFPAKKPKSASLFVLI